MTEPANETGTLATHLETLVLGPDDRLVIVVKASTEQFHMQEWAEALRRSGFAGRAIVVAGIEQLAVLRGQTTGEGDMPKTP